MNHSTFPTNTQSNSIETTTAIDLGREYMRRHPGTFYVAGRHSEGWYRMKRARLMAMPTPAICDEIRRLIDTWPTPTLPGAFEETESYLRAKLYTDPAMLEGTPGVKVIDGHPSSARLALDKMSDDDFAAIDPKYTRGAHTHTEAQRRTGYERCKFGRAARRHLAKVEFLTPERVKELRELDDMRRELDKARIELEAAQQAATGASGAAGTVGPNSGNQTGSGAQNGPQAQASAPAPQPQTKASRATGTRSDRLIQALESLGITFRLNRLEDNIEVNGERLDDVKESAIKLMMRDQSFSRADTTDAINVLAGRNAYDPVEDYLLGLQWDGQNHVGQMLTYLTGDGTMVHYKSGDHPLYAALISRWLAGAVARGLDRGKSAFNHQTPMLVLIGPQGIGKSSWARWLTSGIGFEYHRESTLDPHNPEHIRSMVNKWIWEVSELGSSLRRGDRDSLKSFITQEWHTYRKPWGKHPITKPTLCNFVGTLNPETGFLDDPTGHPRFLPVDITAIDHGYSKAIDVNQMWAQVVHEYRAGRLTPELNAAERAALAAVYKEHEVENPLETYIRMYFDVDPSNAAWKAHTASIIQRLREFGILLPADPKVAGRKINDALATMGLALQKHPFTVGTVRGRGYFGIQPNIKVPPTYKGFP